MKYYDYVRKEPDKDMRELAGKLGVELLYGLKHVGIAKNIAEAKSLVRRKRAVFTPQVDEALISLAHQEGALLGIFVSDVGPENIRKYIEWVEVVTRSRVPVLLATGARSVLELRAPRDVARMGILLGMRRESAFAAVSKRWGVVLETA